MIHVAHVITQLELGGAQENTLYTCEHLDRDRFQVSLIYGPGGILDPEAERIPALERIAVPELIRFVRPGQDATALLQLARTMRDLRRRHQSAGHDPRAFIVHTHSSKAGVLGRLAARLAGVPKVVHTIHGFGFYEGQAPLKYHSFLAAERAVAPLTHAFIGVSRANLAEAAARGLIHRGHVVELIRSGFPLAPFREVRPSARRELRDRLGLGPDIPVLLSVANLKSQKDPMTLVEAFAQLRALRPEAVLLYAGDGPLRASVERAIERHGMGAHFRLLGWRTDVPELMAAADVVVLASRFEGLPKTAVQALAARRPFVGTRVDGTPEVIREGRNGFLVEPRDPTALARAMRRALDERPVDPEDQRRIEAWDADQMVRAQERLYERLLSRQ